ncbi:MAG: hypothetical protein JST61_02290 [Acidobacteria bacterium]|nr:hypothetical protein [Acidobacteriota bacterium]
MSAQVKSMITKAMMVALFAGTVVVAGAKKSEAQQFSIGVQIGQPVVYPGYYAQPGYGYYANRDYYERLRCEQERREAMARQEAWERQQEWMRHEQRERWEHDRYDGWRDHDRDRDWDRR